MGMILILLLLLPLRAEAREPQYTKMCITGYCPESCAGTITASGDEVREGIAAVTDKHYGKTAIVWTRDMKYIGTYECLDKIGTGEDLVIDIWKPSLSDVKELMEETDGKCIVQFVDAHG